MSDTATTRREESGEDVKIWSCKIGEVTRDQLPKGSDLPMREAITRRYVAVTGQEPDFLFSGWGAELTEGERAVVEDRPPVPTSEALDDSLSLAVAHHYAGALTWIAENEPHRGEGLGPHDGCVPCFARHTLMSDPPGPLATSSPPDAPTGEVSESGARPADTSVAFGPGSLTSSPTPTEHEAAIREALAVGFLDKQPTIEAFEAAHAALAALLAEVEQLREENVQLDADVQRLKSWEPENELRERIEAAEAVVEQQTAALERIATADHWSPPSNHGEQVVLWMVGIARAALRAGAGPETEKT